MSLRLFFFLERKTLNDLDIGFHQGIILESSRFALLQGKIQICSVIFCIYFKERSAYSTARVEETFTVPINNAGTPSELNEVSLLKKMVCVCTHTHT